MDYQLLVRTTLSNNGDISFPDKTVFFPSSRAGKSGLKFDSEGWGDALFVPAFSIGYQQFLDKALYNEYLQRREEYMHARPMEEFLLYFPLFSQTYLADFVYRTMGDTCNNRAYVYKKMDWLIKSIPNNAAKRYADKMRYFCLTKPNVYEIADCVVNDAQTEKKLEEFFAYEDSEEYRIESQAYFDICTKAVNRLSFLDKLKRQMEEIFPAENV